MDPTLHAMNLAQLPDTKPDPEMLRLHMQRHRQSAGDDPMEDRRGFPTGHHAVIPDRYCGGAAAGGQGGQQGYDCAPSTATPRRESSTSPPSVAEFIDPVRGSLNSPPAALPIGGWSAAAGIPSPSFGCSASSAAAAAAAAAAGVMAAGAGGSDKRQCAICGDRATGKHYGVYSCEGCKGFFKRTVRKDLQYACREDKDCIVDRRQRNRCQYCRYQKCLVMGMRREAVQEERMAAAGDMKCDFEAESTSSLLVNTNISVESLCNAELASEPRFESFVDAKDDPIGTFCHAAEKQLFTLVDWAKCIPHFVDLPIEDQVTLLRSGWNELLIAGFSHRSMSVQDSILLCTGLRVTRDMATEAGVGLIFDRVLVELVAKMREMEMDKTELGCLRAIVLFNPDAKGLLSVSIVETLREKVYAAMDEYCRRTHPNEPGRFAKLLLRLPALRSIGLKCIDHLFFYKLVTDSHVDTFLLEMLDIPSAPNS